MTRNDKNHSFALVSSTIGTTLVSIAAAWLVTSLAFAPVTVNPDPSKWDQSSSRPLYRLSPIPASADWAA
jgi:hypothetical protein